MMKSHLRAALAGALALAALSPASAQESDADLRLKLAGNYIGAHLLMFSAHYFCQFSQGRVYDETAAVAALQNHMRPDEMEFLRAYLTSPELEQDRKTTYQTVEKLHGSYRSQGLSPEDACQELETRLMETLTEAEERLLDMP